MELEDQAPEREYQRREARAEPNADRNANVDGIELPGVLDGRCGVGPALSRTAANIRADLALLLSPVPLNTVGAYLDGQDSPAPESHRSTSRKRSAVGNMLTRRTPVLKKMPRKPLAANRCLPGGKPFSHSTLVTITWADGTVSRHRLYDWKPSS